MTGRWISCATGVAGAASGISTSTTSPGLTVAFDLVGRPPSVTRPSFTRRCNWDRECCWSRPARYTSSRRPALSGSTVNVCRSMCAAGNPCLSGAVSTWSRLYRPVQHTLVSALLPGRGGTAIPDAQHVEHHADDAYRDGGIGHVERPEVILAPVDVHEVHDVSRGDPVYQIAGSAPEDQGEPQPREPLVGREPGREPGDTDQRRRRDERNHGCLVREVGGVQDAKRRPAVPVSYTHLTLPTIYSV